MILILKEAVPQTMKANVRMNRTTTGKTYWLPLMRICDVFRFFEPLDSLKNVKSTRRGVLPLITLLKNALSSSV